MEVLLLFLEKRIRTIVITVLYPEYNKNKVYNYSQRRRKMHQSVSDYCK